MTDPLAARRLDDTASLWDWRRQVFSLYSAVRSMTSIEGWSLWRATRDRLFRDHPQSPLPTGLRPAHPGLPCFDYAPELRFCVELAPALSPEHLTFQAGRDGAVRLEAFAQTHGLAGRLGQELTLYWIGGYGGGVFLPFRDATSGQETFAGGRYLLDTIKGADLGSDADGRCVLDFNFAYNPSCSYSEDWVCPLAPTTNTLAEPIRAGERLT